jgi:surfeit locus 1 family protein
MPRPFPLIPSLVTLAGVIILCLLGHWQQDRLAWKNALQDSLNREFEKPAQDIELTSAALSSLDSTSIKRGTISGHLDFSRQILLRGQIIDGKPVSYVLIPMELEDNSHIFIVAGYGSGEAEIPAPSHRDSVDRVTGTARLPSWNMFTPENRPDRNRWFRADVPQLASHLKLEHPLPPLFYLEQSNFRMGALPPVEVPRALRNEHLQYAIFWYTMAGVLLIMYILRFWRTRD